MSPERTQSYRRVMRTLDDLGPAKLLASEQERIRYAADTLIFSTELSRDDAALDALHDVEQLGRALETSGRWETVTVERLLGDIAGCGPARPPALQAA